MMCWLLGMLFLAGLALAGSDGPWFPWANCAGAWLLGAAGILSEKMLSSRPGHRDGLSSALRCKRQDCERGNHLE